MPDTETLAGIAIIGAGPAGLAAAEVLLARGVRVTLFDAMPSVGRKFLMAGKSGLNITHAEEPAHFLTRYGPPDPRLLAAIRTFDNRAVAAWVESLGVPIFTGSSGRVFPRAMKASPLLRAWLAALDDGGADIRQRWRWRGWTQDGACHFDTPDGERAVRAQATIFALGGASWRRLGSDGAWAGPFRDAGIALEPFSASNCGFTVDWSPAMAARAGAAVKPVRLTAPDGTTSRGEFVLTRTGIESGGVYALSAPLRAALQHGDGAQLTVDLAPDVTVEALAARLDRAPKGQSRANTLRKAARLDAPKRALFFECASGLERTGNPDPAAKINGTPALAARIKSLPLRIIGISDMDGAISTAGGVAFRALDERFMLHGRPGTFCAGEMIAWDAPTGGYLLTACLATGRAAGNGAADYLAAHG